MEDALQTAVSFGTIIKSLSSNYSNGINRDHLIPRYLWLLVCEEGPGICALILTACSMLLIVVTLPASLLFTVKVVQVVLIILHNLFILLKNIYFRWFQEYERAVIFRLGRLLSGGARGPGVFFIIPCVDIYEKIDMRTATFEIPPQEVIVILHHSWKGVK